MIEIRIHGRGGQGAVTTGQIIAIASLYDNKYAQTFPLFGVERRGAPVEAFVRIDSSPINLRSQVYNPDVVMVLDPTLVYSTDVTKGLKDKGTIIINTSKKPKDLKIKGDYNIHTIDASAIALNIFKRPIVNTPILGAFSAVTKLVSLKSMMKAIDEKFAASKGKAMAEMNKKAVKDVYDMVR
ncbi:pyruvate ferredoxin oxidoreductase [Candidatus Woesearchaeota archaeon CG10_big_fil_rev_8_21_14_0_10_44_13]|nr:MAG: pyruvate ferredoxin oxidoreductase [Candidatus Woesearchaeota archaeon CG10_big_fil_rev_8_21_14_0_10_44_13]